MSYAALHTTAEVSRDYFVKVKKYRGKWQKLPQATRGPFPEIYPEISRSAAPADSASAQTDNGFGGEKVKMPMVSATAQ
jgi:hypothetical protein